MAAHSDPHEYCRRIQEDLAKRLNDSRSLSGALGFLLLLVGIAHPDLAGC